MTEDTWQFGTALKAAREAKRMSIRAAARKADLSEALWRQMEAGYRVVAKDVRIPARPRLSTVQAAADVVGLDEDEAIRLAGLPPLTEADRAHREIRRKATPVEPYVPPAEVAWLTERQRRALDELIRAIAEPTVRPDGDRGDPPTVRPTMSEARARLAALLPIEEQDRRKRLDDGT